MTMDRIKAVAAIIGLFMPFWGAEAAQTQLCPMLMPLEPRSSEDNPPKAEAALAEFLRLKAAGEAVDFEAFCTERPEVAKALRVLYSIQGDSQQILSKEVFARLVQAKLAADAEETLPRPGIEPRSPAAPPDRVLDWLTRPLFEKTRYTVRGEVARGGMGVILNAWDEHLKRPVAMKVMLHACSPTGVDASTPADPKLLARFLNEAQITGQLDHPGVVPVHEVGIDNAGKLYFTMRLVDGRHLREVFDLAWEGKEGWTQTRVLGVLVKVCEALAYAHSKGVIHRDLKPANIMVGGFGETYVMDWGLAKALGEADGKDLRIRLDGAEPRREGGSSLREGGSSQDTAAQDSPFSPLVTMDGSVIGTPAYMPPEQAQGDIDAIDARSDVYSVGAMLYQLLTREMPYVRPGARVSPRGVLDAVRKGPPAPVHEINPLIPPELAAICDKAMARSKEKRYPSTKEMAEDLQAFLENRVVAAYRTGAVVEFKKWVVRNKGMALSLGAAGLLGIAGLIAVIVVQAGANRETLLRTDVYVESGLKSAAENELWPAFPEKVPALEDWISKALDLVSRLPVHRARLEAVGRAALPARGGEQGKWVFQSPDLQLEHDSLSALVSGLELLVLPTPKKGTIADIRERLEFARTVRKRTIDDHREAWERAIASIASREECPKYGGLVIQPQLGLIPVGLDKESGLWEFAHIQTGGIPKRDADGRLVKEEDMGLIFVLIPGGTFSMGAVKSPQSGPNLCSDARPEEGPVHDVTLKPFFISKFEMTQGQWRHFTGETPSLYEPGGKYHDKQHSLLDPVESVSWETCMQVLSRLGLSLPTEAQWEYATRAGTTTPWWTGATKETLAGAVNLADQTAAREYRNWPGPKDWPELDDGYFVHAPVGSFRPNPFGLCDCHGNVSEWCLDFFSWDSYKQVPGETNGEHVSRGAKLRTARGGSYFSTAQNARSSFRIKRSPGDADPEIGVRPVRSLTVESSKA
jgi:formylglycine-generating enzyme required for sulfatase activity/serine/threonine protein kinase